MNVNEMALKRVGRVTVEENSGSRQTPNGDRSLLYKSVSE